MANENSSEQLDTDAEWPTDRERELYAARLAIKIRRAQLAQEAKDAATSTWRIAASQWRR